MNDRRPPRSRFYDGHVYGSLIDPLMRGLQRIVIDHLGPAKRVLDACCGTGALGLRLGALGKEVLGVDLSPRNIGLACKRLAKMQLDGVRFEVGDVAHLEGHENDSFSAATIVMALHEMPGTFRSDVLREVARVATRVIVVDYAIPMPRNFAGWRNRAIEFAAGQEHFAGFRDFTQRGGLALLADQAGLRVLETRALESGTLALWELSRRR